MKKGFLLFKGWCHMTEHVQTTLAQIGNRSDEITGTVNPPVYFSSAYRHK
ncbi:methionine biosynthesis PLP-dependent protein, partial [Bacillus haynesii]|nr:methionine biosynthesis PLP-dependent protein [Bacillus haynesii]